MPKPKPDIAKYDPVIDEVLTVQEVADRYHYTPQNIRIWCLFDYVSARQAGKVWLISRASVEKHITEFRQGKVTSTVDT